MKALSAPLPGKFSKVAAPPSVLAVAGLALLALVIFVFGSAVRVTLEGWLAIAAIALGLGGLALFNVSMFVRAGRRDRVLAQVNEELQTGMAELTERNQALETAKRHTEAILASVPSRLLVIDASFAIQESFTAELAAVFPPNGGKTFLDMLARLVPETTLEAGRKHLSALFDSSNEERSLATVNPLRSIQVTATDDEGSILERGIGFTFRRICENGTVTSVLIAVEDTTEQLSTEKRLRESEARKTRQFETLLGILHVDPPALDEFIKNAQAELGAIDRSLRAADFASGSSQMSLLRQRLESISDRVGAIKDAATLLRFEHFVRRSGSYQDRIAELKTKPAITGAEFLQLVIEQSEFRTEFDDLQALRFKLGALRRAAQIQDDAGDEIVAAISELAGELASELGREVVIDAERFDSKDLAPERKLMVRDVLAELTRNAIVHGIEEPAEREAAGKPRTGMIEVRRIRDALAGSFAFTFRDNGRGIDPLVIRERSVELGMLDDERAESMNDSDAAGYIFVPGFTTAGNVLGVAARGMGLNMVKRRIVDECGGTISIDSESGAFSEFTFVVPSLRGAAVLGLGATAKS